MNNYTLHTADSLTHLKIVVVSLVAGIVTVAIGIAARPTLTLPDIDTRLESRAPTFKAGKPLLWSHSEQITVR